MLLRRDILRKNWRGERGNGMDRWLAGRDMKMMELVCREWFDEGKFPSSCAMIR